MLPHEYSVVGHSRSRVGRWLYSGAAALASVFTAVGVTLGNVAGSLGLPVWAQTAVVAPVSAAAVFGVVHWAFGKYGWRALCWFSQMPNISGDWNCKGETRSLDGAVTHEWQAAASITQDWERIKVGLKTAQSGSYSVSAALMPEGDGGWLLMYSYKNEPRAGEPELHAHVGYCEMHFERCMARAEGDYFNARGRGTFGRMILTRKARDGS